MFRQTSIYIAIAAALAGSLCPAHAEAVVDAAAKPYIVGGGWAAGLVFAALGAYFLQKGLTYRRTAAAMSGWPEITGKVIESTVTTRIDKSADGPNITRHIPQVRYAYVADGVVREGTTIRIGLADIGYPTDAQAREHAGRYPAGSRVAVRYDPSRPTTAVLESGQVGGTGKVVAGALFLIVGIAILAIAIWIGGLETR